MAADLEFRIPADSPAAFAAASAALRGLLERHGVGAHARHAADLAFEEIGMNLRTHALAGRPGASFVVQATLEPGRLLLVFLDDGPAFDPTAASPPVPALSMARIGGLGLEMVRKAAGRMTWRRDGPHNRLEVEIPRGG